MRAALEPTRPADEPAWRESALSAVDEPGAKLTRAHRHALRAGGRRKTSLVAAGSSGTQRADVQACAAASMKNFTSVTTHQR